jgi:16S rRNA (guanine527-N7)-methyltransferase
LPVVVHNARAEHTRIEGLDVVTARACAPMVRLLGFVEPMMRCGAEGLFLKGRDVEPEIREARAVWRFTAELIPSQSGAGGNIVKVKRVNRV